MIQITTELMSQRHVDAELQKMWRNVVPVSDADAMALHTIDEWAAMWGIDPDLLVVAAQICNVWWVTKPSQQARRYQMDVVDAFLRTSGLVSTLQAHGDVRCVPSPVIPQANEVDVERIGKLIDVNRCSLRGLKWKWFVGGLLVAIAESKPAMRVVGSRGIRVCDVEEAIRRDAEFASLIPEGGLTPQRVISEMKRMHTARLGFLWLKEESGIPTLTCLNREGSSVPKRHAREFGKPVFAAGEIVWASLEEVTNGRRSRRKHPALLLQLTGHRNDKWILVSFTSDVEGSPEHRRIERFEELGLSHGGYVWHEPMKVHASQIESHIGWVTHDLIQVVDNAINLRGNVAAELRRIADQHRGLAA